MEKMTRPATAALNLILDMRFIPEIMSALPQGGYQSDWFWRLETAPGLNQRPGTPGKLLFN
jgi:hypothetical protein